MGFWDILLNENIYISALSSLENPGRYSHHQTSSPKPSLGTNPEPRDVLVPPNKVVESNPEPLVKNPYK